jgi:hypothetical protein
MDKRWQCSPCRNVTVSYEKPAAFVTLGFHIAWQLLFDGFINSVTSEDLSPQRGTKTGFLVYEDLVYTRWISLHRKTVVFVKPMSMFVTLTTEVAIAADSLLLKRNRLLSILIPVLYIFYYFVLWPKNSQLFHKLSQSYMFRHYRVTLWEFLINTLPSYTSIWNAAVGNTVYN